jgi:hypothetical protein
VKLRELIDRLSDYLDEDDETGPEVRLAIQPNYPFEYSIGEVAENDGGDIVYIGEGSQLDYLPGDARDALGWS